MTEATQHNSRWQCEVIAFGVRWYHVHLQHWKTKTQQQPHLLPSFLSQIIVDSLKFSILVFNMCLSFVKYTSWSDIWGQCWLVFKNTELCFMHKVGRSWSRDKMFTGWIVLERWKTTTVKHCCSHGLKHLVKFELLLPCITCCDQNESRELLLLTCGK